MIQEYPFHLVSGEPDAFHDCEKHGSQRQETNLAVGEFASNAFVLT
jgi:hypothetical protein